MRNKTSENIARFCCQTIREGDGFDFVNVLEIGRLRPLGASIRNGEIMHTGFIPFLKKWFGDLKSCCVTPDTWVEIIDEDISEE